MSVDPDRTLDDPVMVWLVPNARLQHRDAFSSNASGPLAESEAVSDSLKLALQESRYV